MARKTYTQLQNMSKTYISQSSGSFTGGTVAAFIQEQLNDGMHFIQRKLEGYIVQDVPQTLTTVADTQRYYYPTGITPPITSATLEIGNVNYPLTIINSQKRWDWLNEIDFSGTSIPQYILPLRNQFEIWPIPTSAGNTITILSSILDKDMSAEDYTTGTVTVTNDDATVTGSGTTFTAAMVGRWLKSDDDGYWYRIESVTDSTNLELETPFEGTTAAGASYTIAETPEIPYELHSLLPHYVAMKFFAGPRKDLRASQMHANIFYTGEPGNNSRDLNNRAVAGGLIFALRKYGNRGETVVINKSIPSHALFDERWTSTITSSI